MLSSSFGLLRSCSVASSSRTVSRTALRAFPARSTRYYSDDKAPETPKSEEAKSSDQPADELKVCEEKLKTKEGEVADLKSRLQYLQADYINLQRNSAKEKDQQKDYAITRFAKDLLETVDVLAIAVKSIPSGALSQTDAAKETPSSDTKTYATYLKELHTGVDMTHRMLLQTLAKSHVTPFDPTGEPFDPNMHEALYQAPIPGKTPGTVIDTQKIGYKIKDRVLRAAQVGVAQDTS